MRSILMDATESLTLLAPIDEAFEAIHPKIVGFLTSPENAVFLRYILMGHLFQGKLSSSDLGRESDLMAENGSSNRVTVDENKDIFIETAKILTTDIQASNGVLHTLDSLVNIPPLSDVLHLMMEQAFASAGLMDQIMNGTTLFLPSLFAFAGLSSILPDLSDAILNDPSFRLHLESLLRAHVVPDIVFASQLQDGQNITTDNGDVFVFSASNDTLALSPGLTNGKATVLEANVVTVSTVVHQVDGLLFASFLGKTLVDVAAEYASIMASLVVFAEMDEWLASKFNITGMFPLYHFFKCNCIAHLFLKTKYRLFGFGI